MFTKKTMLRAAGGSLAVVLSLAAQPVRAQSDAERLQKLEQAVSTLQKRNAQLEQEVSSLKKHSATEPVAGVGKTKTEVTYDGKTYVEKSVPVEKSSADKWKLSTSVTEMELYGDIRLRYQYNGGRTDDTPVAEPGAGVAGTHDWQERERERYRLRLGLRGTLLDDWFFGLRVETSNNARQQMSRLATTQRVARPVAADHSKKTATRSTSARRMGVTRAFTILRSLQAECRTRSLIRAWCGTQTSIQRDWLSNGNIHSRSVAEK
jgi:hypothetical protein